MKCNNLMMLKCTTASFYRQWVEILTPFHKLTSRERDAAARIIAQYFKLSASCSNPELLAEMLWSHASRRDMRESLGMSQAHFQTIIARLKEAGFINDNKINPRFLPHMQPGDSRFMLCVVFDMTTSTNPSDGKQ